jgi:hypothetical protein
MFRTERPAGRRLTAIAAGVLAGIVATTSAVAYAQAPQAAAAPAQRLFPNGAGMILNFVKPDKTADFEMVMNRLKEALGKSEKPERKQQAMGWRVYKSPDPAGGNVLYVVLIDPSVLGADYTVANILSEAFPKEANELYTKFAESLAQGLNIVNLSLLNDFAK